MATFGNTTIFTDGELVIPDDYKYSFHFTVPLDCAAINKIYFYGRSASGGGVANAVIYDDAVDKPNLLQPLSEIAFDGGSALSDTSAWHCADYGAATPIVAPGAVAWFTIHAGIEDVLIARSASITTPNYGNADAFMDGASNPFGETTEVNIWEVSMYMVYTSTTGPSAGQRIARLKLTRRGRVDVLEWS